MNNNELKRLIKNAYSTETPVRKREFLRAHPQRSLHYPRLLFMQLQYMKVQLTAVFSYVLASLLGALTDTNADVAGITAVFIPVIALIALTGLGKSEKYGMNEIEMSTRFSLRTIRTLQLIIIGTVSLAVMTAISWTLKKSAGTDFLLSIAMVGIPYLMTAFLCMLLVRRWHSSKNIYGCIAIAFAVSIAMFGGLEYVPAVSVGFFRSALFLSFVILFLITVAEAYKYIRGSEELLWNLC